MPDCHGLVVVASHSGIRVAKPRRPQIRRRVVTTWARRCDRTVARTASGHCQSAAIVSVRQCRIARRLSCRSLSATTVAVCQRRRSQECGWAVEGRGAGAQGGGGGEGGGGLGGGGGGGGLLGGTAWGRAAPDAEACRSVVTGDAGGGGGLVAGGCGGVAGEGVGAGGLGGAFTRAGRTGVVGVGRGRCLGG